MEVNVKLFATLQEGHFDETKTEMAENSRVTDVINKYNLPQEKVSICIVNGHNVDKEHVLNQGDTVSLFPEVGGM